MFTEATSTIDQTVVQAAFDRLSPLHQQLLLWHRIDGLTYAEIGDRLDISERKVVRIMGDMIYAWCCAFEQEQGATNCVRGRVDERSRGRV